MKIIQYLSCMVLASCLGTALYAQEDDKIIQADQLRPQALTDQAISQRLQKDLNKRNPKIKNESIQWYEIGDGYYGVYSNNNQHYMTLYDVNGNYVETLKKSDWGTKLPNPLKSSFDLSDYRKQEVTSYWEVSDINRKGYYIEVTDDEGKISRLWANEKGDFSTTIPKVKLKY